MWSSNKNHWIEPMIPLKSRYFDSLHYFYKQYQKVVFPFQSPSVSLHLYCGICHLPVDDTVSAWVHVPESPAGSIERQPQAHRHKQRDEEDPREEVGATVGNAGHVRSSRVE